MMLREPWRTRLLFLSFAINLLLIPIAGARFLTRHPPSPPLTPGLPPTEMIIERMVRELPAADANQFRATMEDHLGDIEAARARLLAARGAMSRAIGRSPYDAALMRTSMQTWQSSWTMWSEALGQGMLAALPELSDEGRQRLATVGRHRPAP